MSTKNPGTRSTARRLANVFGAVFTVPIATLALRWSERNARWRRE